MSKRNRTKRKAIFEEKRHRELRKLATPSLQKSAGGSAGGSTACGAAGTPTSAVRARCILGELQTPHGENGRSQPSQPSQDLLSFSVCRAPSHDEDAESVATKENGRVEGRSSGCGYMQVLKEKEKLRVLQKVLVGAFSTLKEKQAVYDVAKVDLNTRIEAVTMREVRVGGREKAMDVSEGAAGAAAREQPPQHQDLEGQKEVLRRQKEVLRQLRGLVDRRGQLLFSDKS